MASNNGSLNETNQDQLVKNDDNHVASDESGKEVDAPGKNKDPIKDKNNKN